MKILTIDTSSKRAVVAITEDAKKIIELNNEEEKTHSQKLMPMIDEAFRRSNLSLENIELLVCCLGPGSFTGVRIGIATAKAFADSKNIPTVGVNSLEGLAYSLDREGTICSLIDAGHGNTYAGLFQLKKQKTGELQTIREELTFLNLTEENLVEFLAKNIEEKQTIYFVGDGVTAYQEVVKKLKGKNLYEVKMEQQNAFSGIVLATIGYTKFKSGKSYDSSGLVPIYLRKSQAELALENKKVEGKESGIRNN